MKKTILALALSLVILFSFTSMAQAQSAPDWREALESNPLYRLEESRGEECVVISELPVYTAVLNGLGQYSVDASRRMLIPLEALAEIDHLSIDDERGQPVDLTILAFMPNLEYLSLYTPGVDYSPLAACSALETLYLSADQDDEGTNAEALCGVDVSFAASLPKLKSLSISIRGLTDPDAMSTLDLSPLAGHPKLEKFSFSLSSSIYDEEPLRFEMDLAPAAVPTLKECSLSFSYVEGQIDVGALKEAAALEKLYVYSYGTDAHVTSTGWGELGGLKKLNNLSISHAESADVTALLQEKSKLQKLSLYYMPLSAELAAAVPSKLTELELIGLDAEEGAELPKLKNLKKLMLSSCSGIDLAFLSGLTVCKELNMSGLTAEMDVSPIGSMKALTTVSLSADQYSEAPDLEWMSKAKWRSKATELIIYNFEVSDLSFLSGYTGLTRLYVEGPTTDAAPLAKLKKLKNLSLQDSKIEDITPLSKLTNLEGLILSGSLVSDVTPLAKCKKLTHLSVDGTRVTDLSPLEKLPKLRYVTVSSYCEIIPEHLQVTVNEWAQWPTGDTGAPLDSTAEQMLNASTAEGAMADREFAPFMGVQLKREGGMLTLYNAEDQNVIIPPKPAQYAVYEPLGNGETVITYHFPVLFKDEEGYLSSFSYRLDGTPVELDRRAGLPVQWNRETRQDELLNASGECVGMADDIEYLGHELYILRNYREVQSCSVMDSEGNVLLPASEGMYVELCDIDGGWILLVEYEEPYSFNYLKMDGAWMFEEPVERAEAFSEGVAPVKLPGNDLMSFIDPEGNEVLPARYIGAKPFSEGVALVVNEDWSRSYIDHEGKRVFSMELSTSSSFRSGHAIISTGSSLYGMMNREGTITMQPQWPELDTFYFENTAGETPCVMVYKYNEETGEEFRWYLDFSGNVIAGGQTQPAGWTGLSVEAAQAQLDQQLDSFYNDDFVSIPLWGE